MAKKPKGRFRTGLSRLAEAFSLLLVTVLTPATTFTVGDDCNLNIRRVNSSPELFVNLGISPTSEALSVLDRAGECIDQVVDLLWRDVIVQLTWGDGDHDPAHVDRNSETVRLALPE